MSDNRDTLQQLIGSRYVLHNVVGHGGMSTVWLADDTHTGRPVALKVLGQEFTDSEEFLSRFRNEALASEHIDNPHVVKTYDYQEVTTPDGHTLCFIAMEYVDGQSLADVVQAHGPLDEAWALDILRQAALGLAAIHDHGLVHRDVKPGNILITPEHHVKITDFGIAKAAAQAPLTRTGMVVGTAQYVSPEQAQGLPVTPATDVYSLAVVGYEMLAGVRPFSGDSSVSVAIAHINQAPPQITTPVTDNARELIGIGLRKDPQRRYATGQEFVTAITAVQHGMRPPQPAALPAPTARPTGVTRAASTVDPSVATTTAASAAAEASGKKSTTIAWVAAAVLVALGVGGAIMLLTRGNGTNEPEPAPTPEVSVVTETATVEVTPTTPSSTTTTTTSTPPSTTETTPEDTVTREAETVTETIIQEVSPEPEDVREDEPAPAAPPATTTATNNEPEQPATTGGEDTAPTGDAGEEQAQ